MLSKNYSTLHHLPIVVFIIGGPCSGKGTLGTLLNQRLGYTHLSAGNLLRQERKRPQSKHGQLIQNYIINGKIVPSFITISLLQAQINRNKATHPKFLIDGFPRNLQNLQSWNKSMQYQVITPFIISLICSQSTMKKRLQSRSQTSNRSDDHLSIIQKRINIYKQCTLPVINWFDSSKRVISINTQQQPQQIFKTLKNKIQQKQQSIL